MKLHGISYWLVLLLLSLCACAEGQVKRESNAQDTVTVCITRTGKKYHECSCRYLSRSSISISLNTAVARGYDACSVCEPPFTKNDKSIAVDRPDTQVQPVQKSSATSRQCMAYTKSGLRCKRTTSNFSGKCWQHE